MIQKIEEDIRAAMREKEVQTLVALRALKSAITNAALEKGNVNAQVTDNEVVSIVRKQIKQRQDSIAQFDRADRADLVFKERQEVKVLEKYLPAELDEGSLDNLISQAILETQAATKKDMGRAIKRALELAAGRVENQAISKKIAAKLL